jgi:hypothetical protein
MNYKERNISEEEQGVESYQVFFLPFVFKQANQQNLTAIVGIEV